MPAGEAGEVAVRAPNVSPGYLDRPEETAAVFRDGWFFTGDVGRLDAEGYLYLFDRKKDVIITGGENVWSTEVEAALYAHPGVVEAAVIGVPDETWGEALLAVVVPAPDSALGAGSGAEILMAHCRERIGGYKVPRRYRFVDALPKSAMGKILKADLRRYRVQWQVTAPTTHEVIAGCFRASGTGSRNPNRWAICLARANFSRSPFGGRLPSR